MGVDKLLNQLHRWAFWELCKGNTDLAWRIIKVHTRKKIEFSKEGWLETQMQDFMAERRKHLC